MREIRAALATLAGAAFLFISHPLVSQAPVEDRTRQSAAQQPQVDMDARLLVEVQSLREEISYLRGTVEELEHRVDQLQEQQQENYSDLDSRVRDLYSGVVASPTVNPSAASANSTNRSAGSSPSANSRASELYEQGFNALRTGERDRAIAAFSDLVKDHPEAPQVPDALYWLGETYWLANRREDSRQTFVQLLEQSPNYRKASDARYRLGVIYEQLGEMDKARSYMQDAAEGSSGQALAAKAWLTEHKSTDSSAENPETQQ